MLQSGCHLVVFEVPHSDCPSVGEIQILAVPCHVELLRVVGIHSCNAEKNTVTVKETIYSSNVHFSVSGELHDIQDAHAQMSHNVYVTAAITVALEATWKKTVSIGICLTWHVSKLWYPVGNPFGAIVYCIILGRCVWNKCTVRFSRWHVGAGTAMDDSDSDSNPPVSEDKLLREDQGTHEKETCSSKSMTTVPTQEWEENKQFMQLMKQKDAEHFRCRSKWRQTPFTSGTLQHFETEKDRRSIWRGWWCWKSGSLKETEPLEEEGELSGLDEMATLVPIMSRKTDREEVQTKRTTNSQRTVHYMCRRWTMTSGPWWITGRKRRTFVYKEHKQLRTSQLWRWSKVVTLAFQTLQRRQKGCWRCLLTPSPWTWSCLMICLWRDAKESWLPQMWTNVTDNGVKWHSCDRTVVWGTKIAVSTKSRLDTQAMPRTTS